MQTLDSFRRLVLTGEWKDSKTALLLIVALPKGTPSQRRFRTATDDGDGIPVTPLASVLVSHETLAAPLVKRENSPYEGFIFVGRAVTSDVVLEYESVSKSHAAFQREGETWFVKDVRSRNGTYVDGRRLEASERIRLHSGSQVTFGSVAAYFVELSQIRQG
jgi:pSer/pThr/pTyr-binding forkhead associated (FHA) protein